MCSKNKITKSKLYSYFWVFFLACIFGSLWEIVLNFIKHGNIVGRSSLIYGQFNIVYGFGALLLIIVLDQIKSKNNFCIFVSGFFVGGAFEYLCSFFQEKVFGTVSWKYGNIPLNLNGRINFIFCIFWGLLSIFWFKFIYKNLIKLLEKIPNKVMVYLTNFLIIFMVFNIAISLIAALRQTERRNGKLPSNKIEVYIDKYYPDDLMDRVYNNAMKIKPK